MTDDAIDNPTPTKPRVFINDPPSISYQSSYVLYSDSCGIYNSCTDAFNALLEIFLSVDFVPNIHGFNAYY